MSERITEYLHSLSLDSSFYDEECGDIQSIGWHAKFNASDPDDSGLVDPDNSIMTEAAREVGLTEWERGEIRNCAGAILRIDNDGFKSSALYDDADSLDRAWLDIVAQQSDDDDDEDFDDNDDEDFPDDDDMDDDEDPEPSATRAAHLQS